MCLEVSIGPKLSETLRQWVHVAISKFHTCNTLSKLFLQNLSWDFRKDSMRWRLGRVEGGRVRALRGGQLVQNMPRPLLPAPSWRLLPCSPGLWGTIPIWLHCLSVCHLRLGQTFDKTEISGHQEGDRNCLSLPLFSVEYKARKGAASTDPAFRHKHAPGVT